MNRLVIVGNGFDLAHGLPTSYKDFINNYWSSLKLRYEEQLIKDITYVNPEFFKVLSINPIKKFDDLILNLREYCQEYGYFFDEKNIVARDKRTSGFKEIFKFENHFFKQLNQALNIDKWVDIENEYYSELKRISKRSDLDFGIKIERAKTLNKEFEIIKLLLSDYLCNNVEREDSHNYEPDDAFSLLNLFKVDYMDLRNNPNSKFLKEYRKIDHQHLVEKDEELYEFLNDEKQGVAASRIGLSYPTTLFLNFNYTNTVNYYNGKILNYKSGYAQIIHIHGQLPLFDCKKGADICFGFGDEIDEDYDYIQNLDTNVFLENFKSFFYSQNFFYRDLLDYLDSGKYQVFIMGHSCGLSDRTLLSTIFEHANCRSIKVFYHLRKDGSDNFKEISQNISRHFKDKKLMREILVNKTHSTPFPQNIRFVERGEKPKK